MTVRECVLTCIFSFQSQVQGEGLPAPEDGIPAQAGRTRGGGRRDEGGGRGKLSLKLPTQDVLLTRPLVSHFIISLPREENGKGESERLNLGCGGKM